MVTNCDRAFASVLDVLHLECLLKSGERVFGRFSDASEVQARVR